MNPLPSLNPKLRDGLPFVYMNLAITADGKLAPANRRFVPFSSKHDQDLLIKLRTRCDAVMAGARTVDSVPVNLGPGGKRYRDMRITNGLSPYNLRVISSGSGSISPNAEIFRHAFSPIVILVTERAKKRSIKRLQNLGAIVKTCGEKQIDFRFALQWLRKEWNVKRLLCEGGGEVNAALLQEGLVNEIYITLCPVVFGGRHAPTLADGVGIGNLAEATTLKLKASERVGKELLLVYSVKGQVGAGGVRRHQTLESAPRRRPFRAT